MSAFFALWNSRYHLLENSIQIAWDYLERAGEIDDAPAASRFLSSKIELMILGTTDRLRRIQMIGEGIEDSNKLDQAREAVQAATQTVKETTQSIADAVQGGRQPRRRSTA